MALRIYNSLTQTKEEFLPADPSRVRIYNCGPTVYNLNHIGNFRSYVSVDILRRYLRFRGYGIEHTMNITDVDDKIIDNAIKQKKTIQDFTAPFVQAFLEDIALLRIENVEHRPRATDSIPTMIEMIREMEKKGHTYAIQGSVYFRLSSFPHYGELSKIDNANLLTAADGRFEADEYTKEDVRDFALWKNKTLENEPCWDSPWGCGRPGWHIECSAMIRDIYGKGGIDIHMGGVDLLFPHHENEIAQSLAAYPGENFARYWMHNEHLLVEGKKMSKSLGNYFTLRDLTKKENAQKLIQEKKAPDFLLKMIEEGRAARAIRYLLLSFQYRTKLNFTFENLRASDTACEKISQTAQRLLEKTGWTVQDLSRAAEDLDRTEGRIPGKRNDSFADPESPAGRAMRQFLEAMDDDINTAKALGVVFDFIHEMNAAVEKNQDTRILKDGLLFLHRINELLDVIDFSGHNKSDINPELETYVLERIEKRNQAKKSKNFAEADQIRNELLEKGIRIVDTPKGTVWEKA